jgi:putative endonuclease
MGYYVYILQSEKDSSYYIGSTPDVNWRLVRHNLGWSRSTKRKIPWKVVYTECYATKHEALVREKEIKRKKSKKYIERLIRGGSCPDSE